MFSTSFLFVVVKIVENALFLQFPYLCSNLKEFLVEKLAKKLTNIFKSLLQRTFKEKNDLTVITTFCIGSS